MSQINSNSICDIDLEDFQLLDPQAQILQTMLSIPLKVAEDMTQLSSQNSDNDQDLEVSVRKKLNLLVNCFLQDVVYKSQIKQTYSNLSLIDQMKSLSGLQSRQKQIIKFSVYLKHHPLQECRNLMAELMLKVLTGDSEHEQ